MIDIEKWMKAYLQLLEDSFGDRVWFVGLQGSYGRGEATESSDLDLVVILDQLQAADIQRYDQLLNELSHRDKICGFLSGKRELFHWEPSDLFQFCHDTIPIRGSLDEVIKGIDGEAVDRAIKIGACNIYHGCVHNMLYEKNEEILRGLYKAATFVVQAVYFRQTGEYIRRIKDLILVAPDDEKKILETFLLLKNGGNAEFENMSEILFSWSGKWISEGEYT